MSDEQRKLLPYEYQLIEALDISKEEYLDFVAQQHIYSDAKEGTALDIRNWEIAAFVIAIIGVLFQVAAILLMPKPSIPQAGGRGQNATRDEIFAPRFGFNNAQQLAAYGDAINLVYTNIAANPDGGVRVATSLIWSAVQSYGNSQLVQLLFVLGAGGISAIDERRSAFGQTALRDLVAQNYWTYFAANYTGPLRNSFLRPDPDGQVKPGDPTRFGSDSLNPYRVRTSPGGEKSDGFSHAYSPTASASFGVYGVVPINVDYNIRNEAGDFVTANNRISMTGWSGAYSPVASNQTIEVVLEKIVNSDNLAEKEADDARQTLSSVFDNSGVFKFGSTKLKLFGADRANVIDGNMKVTFRAIENGRGSSVPYAVKDKDEFGEQLLDIVGLRLEYNSLASIAGPLLNQDARKVNQQGQIVTNLSPPIFGFAPPSGLRGLNAAELAQAGNLYRLETRTGGTIWTKGSPSRRTYTEAVFQRNLTNDERNALQRYADLNSLLQNNDLADDLFYIKSICRIEEASYETVSPCNLIDFSIKARVFKRISGRQDTYGSGQRRGWSTADNGTKNRTSMFLIKIKRTIDANYTYLPGIFVIRRAGDIENYVYFRLNATSLALANWQIKFEPVIDPAAEFATHPELKSTSGERLFHYIENGGDTVVNPLQGVYSGVNFEYSGTRRTTNGIFPPLNISPAGMNEWDLFTNTSDEQVQFSFDNGPEFSLAAVTEQIVTPFSGFPGLYSDLALFGLNMYSGKSVQDLRSFSVFVTEGRRSRLLNHTLPLGRPQTEYLAATANGSANTAPDIFIDTILDANDGIGKYATIESTDLEQLASSKKFCLRYQLFMDGVIAEPTSWRGFWAERAGFSLLELAKVGGRDVLVPAVPYNRATGEIASIVPITALFNQGNILEDSFKEEYIDYGTNTQDVIVTAIYRSADPSTTFPRNTSVDVQLTGTSDDNALRETIDLSAFVTRREQAVMVAKFLCQTRRHSRRAIEFKTFPTDSPVFPGAYIYVELSQNQWDGIYTGSIESGGFLNTPLSPAIPNGDYSILCYSVNGGSTQQINNVQVTNGRATALVGREGQLFVLGTSVRNRRVFRVTEVMMDEEGEVTIRAVEHATDTNGGSLISRGLDTKVAGLFTIDGRPE